MLNYIDDWLILAQSEELITHMKKLELRLNSEKSVLSPVQRTELFSGDGVGFNLDACTSVACTCRVDPNCHERYQARSGAFSLAGSETLRSHGGSSQRHSVRPSPQETIPVLVQKQRVIR